ncbi:FixH family protein [Bradyrhizobium liaoningense]|uniref:FixH family protein n=1 Tax=Bradyrhizobium liaoningense TaxID=43992 RepID=UPI001BAD54E0|nr:FixH family protein [Bradyrhizobium liaoningense]MBR0817600.1 FixH family protein [Bradyrhizobium liaoningense]
MKTLNTARTMAAALTLLAATCLAGTARAEINDYAFQLVHEAVPVGPNEIAVKLMNKKTGKAVPDAVIFASRLDMAPDGMAEMATKLTPVSATEPGVYKFKANLSMAGRWQLSLGAKVQGETGTVENKLVVKAGQ